MREENEKRNTVHENDGNHTELFLTRFQGNFFKISNIINIKHKVIPWAIDD